jgi:hypothetical protein
MDGAQIPKIHRGTHQRVRFAGKILYQDEGVMVVEGFGGGQSGYLIPKNGNHNYQRTNEGFVYSPPKERAKERV